MPDIAQGAVRAGQTRAAATRSEALAQALAYADLRLGRVEGARDIVTVAETFEEYLRGPVPKA